MPSVWAIDLVGPEPVGVLPDYLHAVASSVVDPPGAHHAQVKPFTVRPLEALGGNRYRFAVGLLDDTETPNIVERLDALSPTVRFGSSFYERVGAATLVRSEPWASMVDEARPVERVGLAFRSPTFFRRGSVSHVMPVASVVFGHLRRRWREHAGVAPECVLEDREIQVTRIDLRTVSFTLRSRPAVGVIGEVEYDVSDLEDAERAAIDAFARLAAYAGCGAATTYGCGAVERFRP
jgi:CRISPR-associated endoribonuclease Cas6